MVNVLASPCLKDHEIQAIVSKTIAKAKMRRIYDHVEACDDCWKRIGKATPKLRDTKENASPLMLKLYPDDRPKTRGDCAGGIRPCPFVSCRHHLLSDEDDGQEARVTAMPDFGMVTCSLDVADALQESEMEALDLTTIGKLLHIGRLPEALACLERAVEKVEKGLAGHA